MCAVPPRFGPDERLPRMLGYVTDPGAPGGLDRRELPAPEPGAHDVLIDVRAYAVNRGELRLLEQRADGWQPGPSPPAPAAPRRRARGWWARPTAAAGRSARWCRATASPRCPTPSRSPT